ncbi:MAG: response regulator [Chloroflexi bacterium]|nr:response regulator [Chloroflexota bacterium]
MLSESRAVLIVDDDPSIRVLLHQLLKSEGYVPTVAADGAEAMKQVAEKEFAVVLLDMRLPDRSGLDILRSLRQDCPDTAVIMVTAFAEVETAVEAMKTGAFDYIGKPFAIDEVLVKVEKARERRHLALQVKDYQRNLEAKVAEYRGELHKMMATRIEGLITEATKTSQQAASRGKRGAPNVDTGIKEFGAKILRIIKGSGS